MTWQMGSLIASFPDFSRFKYDFYCKKREVRREMIPYGKKSKATFAGYGVRCDGIWDDFYADASEKCQFRIPLQKKLTKAMYLQALEHANQHPFHKITGHTDYDYPVDVDK